MLNERNEIIAFKLFASEITYIATRDTPCTYHWWQMHILKRSKDLTLVVTCRRLRKCIDEENKIRTYKKR
jgi:hypothetical protein